MEKRDFTDIYKGNKKIHSHCDFDQNFTFYYDETNNVKKFWFKPSPDGSDSELNVSIDNNFILGGVCFKQKIADLSPIISMLTLQPSTIATNEVKLKHIAKGSFTECLGFFNLKVILSEILRYIKDGTMTVHITNLNYMYFSLVDIIDELYNNQPHDWQLNRKLKSQLYSVFVSNKVEFLKLLKKINFPNLSTENYQLLIEYCINVAHLFSFNELIDYLSISLPLSKAHDSVLLSGNAENVLLENLIAFYHQKIYSYPKSFHIFDNEGEIIDSFNGIEYIVEGVSLNNYKFIDSRSDFALSISDVWVGIYSKLVSFCKSMTLDELYEWVKKFGTIATDTQKENISLLCKIIDYSWIQNPECYLTIDADYEVEKLNYFVETFK